VNPPVPAVNYAPLQVMDTAWSAAFKAAVHSWRVLLFVLAFVLSIGLLAIGQFVFIFAVVVAGLAYVSAQARRIKNQAWVTFALANDWTLDTATPAAVIIPPSLQFGHSPVLSPVIQARLGDLTCDFTAYHCTTGSGKSARVHYFTVAAMPRAARAPHILLLCKKHAPDIQRDLQNAENLQLEGDFNDYFSLQVEKGQEVDVLTVITPDVMQTLISYDLAEDIEALGDNLYFITASDKRGYHDMPVLVRSVVELGDRLAQNHAFAAPPNALP
jgi:hypothetical protein